MDPGGLSKAPLANEEELDEPMGLVQSACKARRRANGKGAKLSQKEGERGGQMSVRLEPEEEEEASKATGLEKPRGKVQNGHPGASCPVPSRRHSVPSPRRSQSPAKLASPSIGATTFLTNWRRNSVKKTPSNASQNGPSSGEGSGLSNEEVPGPSLSEISHELLVQMIRLFPFSASFPQPALGRPKLARTLSQPIPPCAVPPSSSSSSFGPAQEDRPVVQLQVNSCQNSGAEDSSTSSSHPRPPPAVGPAQRRFQGWQAKATDSFGRLRRAASNLAGTRQQESSKLSPPLFGESTPKNGALSRLCRVSVDTMAITALPLDCWLKERLKNWVQLSGHQGTIVPASNHSLWKKQPQGNANEARAYAEIMLDPALRGITPKFFREIQHRNEAFIEIQDLLAEFPNTWSRAVMDIKIGTRTFLESEVANRKKRPDLYRKMVELAPKEATEEEQLEGAITKLRYMQFRERKSSSATLGFRIEAAQLPGGSLQKDFKRIQTRRQVRQVLMDFFGQRREAIREQLLVRFKQIRDAVEASQFFGTHEVVGSSLLLIHEEGRAGAWLIDFAKCTRVEGEVTHRGQWQLGNHEDGYLTGLDNLIGLLEAEEGEQLD